jgi:hypothetical protein
MSAAATSAMPLRVELSMTADMPDGQPLPPPCDCGAVWHVVMGMIETSSVARGVSRS